MRLVSDFEHLTTADVLVKIKVLISNSEYFCNHSKTCLRELYFHKEYQTFNLFVEFEIKLHILSTYFMKTSTRSCYGWADWATNFLSPIPVITWRNRNRVQLFFAPNHTCTIASISEFQFWISFINWRFKFTRNGLQISILDLLYQLEI
jgi:hypothetical protein